MALPKLYDRVYWDNNTTPAINEDNLNSLSKAVDDIDDRVISLAGTIMEDVPQIQEDLEILEPAIENIDSNVERAETAADDAEDSAETAEYWANVSNPPIPVVKDFASVISVDDAIPKAATDVKIKIEAVQDLHGYTKPWAGGAGKNLLPLVLSTIKSLNTHGTWSGNSFTFNGITYTILTDSDGNITGIRANGTASGRAYIFLCEVNYGDRESTFTNNVIDGYVYSGTIELNKRFIYYNAQSKRTYILIDTGEVCSNIVFYPQRELGTTATAFEPYSNICPISGFTEAKVTRTGKNVFPIKLSEMKSRYETGWSGDALTKNGVTYNFITNGDYITEIRTSGTATSSSGSDLFIIDGIPTFLKDNVNYILTFCPAGGSDSTYLVQYNNWTEGATYIKYDYGEGFTFQKITDSTTQKMRIWIKNGTNADGLVFKPMICLATETDATFAPYNGTDYIIDLDGTRYGATLDVTSGVMVVDKAYKDLGDLIYTYNSDISSMATTISDIKTPTSHEIPLNALLSICPVIPAIDRTTTTGIRAYAFSGEATLYIRDSGYTDPTAFKTAMTGQKIVYELATPITVQLTPTEVQMLQGYNVLSANSGDVYLEYDASMIQRIANEKLDITTFKSVVASSSDFADFKTKVAAL